MKLRRAWPLFSTAVLLGTFAVCVRRTRHDTVVVGSKNFPEQALLGEILAQHIEGRTHLRVRETILPGWQLYLPAGDAQRAHRHVRRIHGHGA